jgi:transposase
MPGPDAEARRDRAHGQSAVHKVAGVAEAIEAAGATLIYVPKYSPDLNPIELAFTKFKAHLRKAAEHTIPRLLRRIGCTVTQFSPHECAISFAMPAMFKPDRNPLGRGSG